jgi:hypothetical protein
MDERHAGDQFHRVGLPQALLFVIPTCPLQQHAYKGEDSWLGVRYSVSITYTVGGKFSKLSKFAGDKRDFWRIFPSKQPGKIGEKSQCQNLSTDFYQGRIFPTPVYHLNIKY